MGTNQQNRLNTGVHLKNKFRSSTILIWFLSDQIGCIASYLCVLICGCGHVAQICEEMRSLTCLSSAHLCSDPQHIGILPPVERYPFGNNHAGPVNSQIVNARVYMSQSIGQTKENECDLIHHSSVVWCLLIVCIC